MKILIYLGTSRQNNYSQHVAKFILDELTANYPVEAEIISSVDYPINFSNEGTGAAIAKLTQKADEADGFIIVSPEYNHGYPATLKYLLDLNYDEFYHKPVAIVAVSQGPFGGTRMTESLISVLKALGMLMTRKDLNFTQVRKEINDQGQLLNPLKWQERLKPVLDELMELLGVSLT